MDKNYLNNLNQIVIAYYKSKCNESLAVASKFCCSEMARYIGHKILNEIPDTKAYVLKGVITKDLAHDILLIHQKGEYALLDPAVWQFFDGKETVSVGEGKSMSSILKLAEKTYGGEWSVSEELDKGISNEELPKLKTILDEIIKENCRQ